MLPIGCIFCSLILIRVLFFLVWGFKKLFHWKNLRRKSSFLWLRFAIKIENRCHRAKFCIYSVCLGPCFEMNLMVFLYNFIFRWQDFLNNIKFHMSVLPKKTEFVFVLKERTIDDSFQELRKKSLEILIENYGKETVTLTQCLFLESSENFTLSDIAGCTLPEPVDHEILPGLQKFSMPWNGIGAEILFIFPT